MAENGFRKGVTIPTSQVVKKDFMAKRAQMKGIIKREGFKSRWFVLSPTVLSYHEGSVESGVGRMKGQIMVENIVIVDVVAAEVFKYRANSFQVVYKVMKDGLEDVYSLYIMAVYEQQMYDWINAIRQVCRDKGCEFSEKYHPGIWLHNQKPPTYSCCGIFNQRVLGCIPATGIDVMSSQDDVAPSPAKTTPRWGHRENSRAGGRPPALPPSPTRAAESPSVLEKISQAPPVAKKRVNGTPERGKPPPPVPTKPSATDGTKYGRVVAVHEYEANEPDELDLIQNEEYDLLEEYKEHSWLRVRNKNRQTGHIPSTFVEPVQSSLPTAESNADSLEKYEWYYANTTRTQAEERLKEDGREGCFMVREAKRSNTSSYSLSLLTRKTAVSDAELIVKHYHVKVASDGKVYFSDRHTFDTIPLLITYHQRDAGGLVTRLRFSPNVQEKMTLDCKEINPKLLKYLEVLGTGQFGIVRKALYDSKLIVAVKEMKENAMSESDFINEASVMLELRHDNLVSLYGVCTAQKPLRIVTEFVKHGALLTYLKSHKNKLQTDSPLLVDMCLQVCTAMEYLEHRRFIHRDLAARNCLVGDKNIIKVADFGLARFVTDDEYTSSIGAKFPVKWSAPEVLAYTTFSSKSDVWAFGILMWEVFTFGEVPYGKTRRNTDVVDAVCNRNKRLSQPAKCPDQIFNVMHSCWRGNPEERPTFVELKEELQQISEDVAS